ncbi:unnamed protein product [Moneuplotes crassus]|uniref:Uncharacterized protein n=1 Tax=Euplotes crassus TaxID=5936 RepID=A0AAD1X153_EUPCR|nr:unnamed protein product [Moneuplotes crassus]
MNSSRITSENKLKITENSIPKISPGNYHILKKGSNHNFDIFREEKSQNIQNLQQSIRERPSSMNHSRSVMNKKKIFDKINFIKKVNFKYTLISKYNNSGERRLRSSAGFRKQLNLIHPDRDPTEDVRGIDIKLEKSDCFKKPHSASMGRKSTMKRHKRKFKISRRRFKNRSRRNRFILDLKVKKLK